MAGTAPRCHPHVARWAATSAVWVDGAPALLHAITFLIAVLIMLMFARDRLSDGSSINVYAYALVIAVLSCFPRSMI